ncbi:hypothetical protein Tco_1085255 [Tanacetum coccineum]
MNRSLFTRIVRDLSANCPYFQEGCDAVGKVGISALVKCTSAIRQLAYAAVPDSLDEYLQIGEKTSRDCLMHFCNGVIELYGEEYLRRPTQTDVEKLYAFHENKHGFPALVQKQIDEDMVHQKAILDLALQFDNACTTKEDLRKAYEKCNHIPQESRALIDTFLKEGSDKDYELNLSMYRKAAKLEKTNEC